MMQVVSQGKSFARKGSTRHLSVIEKRVARPRRNWDPVFLPDGRRRGRERRFGRCSGPHRCPPVSSFARGGLAERGKARRGCPRDASSARGCTGSRPANRVGRRFSRHRTLDSRGHGFGDHRERRGCRQNHGAPACPRSTRRPTNMGDSHVQSTNSRRSGRQGPRRKGKVAIVRRRQACPAFLLRN